MEAVFSEEAHSAERKDAITKTAGRMSKSLIEAEAFDKIEKEMMPLSFVGVVTEGTCVVNREAKPGYVPSLRIQVTLAFAPP